MRLLFAEDEPDLNRILTRRLKEEGYRVDNVFDGEETLRKLQAVRYDAAVLDVMMPKMDGFSVVKAMRERGIRTPVLFLTARDAVRDRVYGLDLGANDYLVKPFSLEELLARIRVLLRNAAETKEEILQEGSLVLNRTAQTVTREGVPVELSAREYRLLEYLMLNRGAILSRERIEANVWEDTEKIGSNIVEVYISYLRAKIDDGNEEKLIRTVRGLGYTIKSEAERRKK
ncbi:MAG: response regulator transcription factor [Lachnospiraceae bacterium]|nr:response regulator transcription factor [Lachnospiraceae bacterium]